MCGPAMFIIALFKIAKKALRRLLHVLVATIAYIAMFFFNVSLLASYVGCCHSGVAIILMCSSLFHSKNITYVEEDEY
jgi:hypothetical protein